MNLRRRLLTAAGAAAAAGAAPRMAAATQSAAQHAAAPATSLPIASAARAAPPPGTRIELPPVRLLDGREIDPAYWRGKVLVVELWATWCPFCARQNPEIDKLHRAHATSGLEVLGLSIDRRADDVQRYMREHGYAFHAAMLDSKWEAALGRPKGLPIVWVIGRSGRLVQVEIGEMFPEDVADLARWLKHGAQG
ncbi:MAG: TlpA family protein disulfide reductase [Burkholderiaceae bacterium]|nr:TlpA family protein disulfide reductase [Burkholderiaceae bacterium]